MQKPPQFNGRKEKKQKPRKTDRKIKKKPITNFAQILGNSFSYKMVKLFYGDFGQNEFSGRFSSLCLDLNLAAGRPLFQRSNISINNQKMPEEKLFSRGQFSFSGLKIKEKVAGQTFVRSFALNLFNSFDQVFLISIR